MLQLQSLWSFCQRLQIKVSHRLFPKAIIVEGDLEVDQVEEEEEVIETEDLSTLDQSPDP